MLNQDKLLEMLQEIREIAAAQQNMLTKEEIAGYLGDDVLAEEQMQAVYRYLGESGIQVGGVLHISDEKENEKGEPAEKESRENNSYRGYEKEASRVSENSEREERMIISYLKGENCLKDRLIEMRLKRVVELAGRYEDRQMPRDEIIAEGNLGLMAAMEIIENNRNEYLRSDGTLNREKFYGTLDLEVIHAMESFIDGEVLAKDWENAMLAKINLLHEAAKYLAEEFGRVPDVAELSEYTKIDEEEVRNLISLSENAKKPVAI